MVWAYGIHYLGWQAARGLGIFAEVDCRCEMRPIDSQTLARLSVLMLVNAVIEVARVLLQ
jgi:hypothetical protein